MTKEEFLAILDKYLEGKASSAEKKLLDEFYDHQLKKSEDYWHTWALTDKERIRIELYTSLERAVDQDLQSAGSLKAPWFSPWKSPLKVAASMALLVGVGLWFFMLMTADPEIRYITKTTQRGQRATITLGDGSTVQLNAESAITFPEQFPSSGERSIQLQGEAFFEVSHNPEKPFIVDAGDLKTTVLGTSFNVRAYPENPSVSVTVASGKVQVQPLTPPDAGVPETAQVYLTAGQQARYHSEAAGISKTTVSLDEHLAWKDGTILLNQVTIEEAAGILGRWYDVEFVFNNEAIKHCIINGKFKSDKLVNILDNLHFLVGLEYSIGLGKKITISGASCNP